MNDVAVVLEAVERTIAAGSARMTFEINREEMKLPELPPTPDELPEEMGSMLNAVKSLLKASDKMPRMVARGYVDFAAGRSSYEYDGYPGMSGGAGWAEPTNLLDLLRAARSATAAEDGHYSVECDVLAVEKDLPLPPVRMVSELRRVPVDVWIDDDGLVWRILGRAGTTPGAARPVIEFSDFGCELPSELRSS